MTAVSMGASSDLKNIIQQSGMKLNITDMNPGEPNDDTFVKQVWKLQGTKKIKKDYVLG